MIPLRQILSDEDRTSTAAAAALHFIDLVWSIAADHAAEAGCPPPPRFLDARVPGVDDTALTDLVAVRP